jgi:hypothetical protein
MTLNDNSPRRAVASAEAEAPAEKVLAPDEMNWRNVYIIAVTYGVMARPLQAREFGKQP